MDLDGLEAALREENYKRNLAKGLRNLINYLKSKRLITRDEFEDLKETILLKPTGTRRIFVSDEEIRQAYHYFEQQGQDKLLFFKLLVFTGLRLSSIHRMLKKYDPDLLVIQGDVAKYPLFFHEGSK